MSEIKVTENEDLSFTVEEITPFEMNKFFKLGIETMLKEFKDNADFIVIEPEEAKELNPEFFDDTADNVTWELEDGEYHQIVQIGMTQILVDAVDNWKEEDERDS